MISSALPAWATELAGVREGDERLDSRIPGVNMALNRARLAAFLAEFAEDRDVRDFLTLDLIGTTAGLPLTSTGAAENIPSLVLRPFRLWEYVWIYKTLGLAHGGLSVLDLGGPGTHLSILTALAGSTVTSVDINPEFVRGAQECARALKLNSLGAVAGDMRDLSRFHAQSFDAVISCSVLEHLTAADQELALQQVARVLRPGGLVGLTFDYGEGAPGANEYLPPPHDPPSGPKEAVRRYSQNGLTPVGNEFSDDPGADCLFQDNTVHYTVAAMFLAKASAPEMRFPRNESAGSVLGNLMIERLPFKAYEGGDRIRDMLHQSRRATLLEEGLASTEQNRLWLLGLVQKYEAEGWWDFTLRWGARQWRRLSGTRRSLPQ